MGLTRQVTKPVLGFVGSFNSASTFVQTYTTAHVVNSGTTYYSQVIDRLELGAGYNVVDVALNLYSTTGSTEGAVTKGLNLAAWLQAGASSGGGDMADVSPPITYPTANFFSTLDTTDFNKYSTGMLNPGIESIRTYDLMAQARYVRAAFSVTRRAGTTTCTDKVDGAWLANTLIFREPDAYPPKALHRFSTSTSTSTSLGY